MINPNKKIEIIESMIRCIGRWGLEQSNATRVAKDLGIAQSGIFYHFPKKENLFDSLVEFIAEENHLLVEAKQEREKHASQLRRLHLHFEGNLLWAKKHPDHVATILHSIAKTTYSNEMRLKVNRIFEIGEKRIYGYLVTGIAENEFSTVFSASETASLIHKSLIGTIVSYHYHSKQKATSHFTNSLTQLCHGLIKARVQ